MSLRKKYRGLLPFWHRFVKPNHMMSCLALHAKRKNDERNGKFSYIERGERPPFSWMRIAEMIKMRGERERERDGERERGREKRRQRCVDQFPSLDSVSWLHTSPRSVQCRSVAKIGQTSYSVMVKVGKVGSIEKLCSCSYPCPVSVSFRQHHYSFFFTIAFCFSETRMRRSIPCR